MKIGFIGAGHIGGNAARLFAAAGHEVLLSFSRDPESLKSLAADIGNLATAGAPADAVEFGEVIFFSVPWSTIPEALRQAGPIQQKVVIDTTNAFGGGGRNAIPAGMTAVEFNQHRMPGSWLVKAFNTLTSGFQASQAGRPKEKRVVLFMAGDDQRAKDIVTGLIEDAGFAAADVGGLADAAVMESPRRHGTFYGEEYRPAEARAALAAIYAGRPIPATPVYTDSGWDS
jgi:predicted dinucleotide-binding enzyme